MPYNSSRQKKIVYVTCQIRLARIGSEIAFLSGKAA